MGCNIFVDVISFLHKVKYGIAMKLWAPFSKFDF